MSGFGRLRFESGVQSSWQEMPPELGHVLAHRARSQSAHAVGRSHLVPAIEVVMMGGTLLRTIRHFIRTPDDVIERL